MGSRGLGTLAGVFARLAMDRRATPAPARPLAS